MSLSRYDFLKITAAVTAGGVVPFREVVQNRRLFKRKSNRPVIIGSRNGLPGVELAYKMLTEEGADPLDAPDRTGNFLPRSVNYNP